MKYYQLNKKKTTLELLGQAVEKKRKEFQAQEPDMAKKKSALLESKLLRNNHEIVY